MENNGTEILRQPMFKTPLMIGPFDPDREGGYNEMNQVSLFGAVWQSKRDNNQTAPAVWDGGNIITPNTTDWFMVSGDYEAWLLNKDKPATTGTTGDYPYNGMGRVTLKKHMVNGHNLLYQDDFYKGEVGSRVPNTNTVFEVPYEFELAEDITLPANCVLEFDGGSLSGSYTITGTNTGIQAGLVKIINTNVTLAGTWNVPEIYADWFGAKADGTTDSTSSINKALVVANAIHSGFVLLSSGTYKTTSTIYLRPNVTLKGAGNTTFTWGGTSATNIYADFAETKSWVISTYAAYNGEEIGYRDTLPGEQVTGGNFTPCPMCGVENLRISTNNRVFGGVRMIGAYSYKRKNVSITGVYYGFATIASWNGGDEQCTTRDHLCAGFFLSKDVNCTYLKNCIAGAVEDSDPGSDYVFADQSNNISVIESYSAGLFTYYCHDLHIENFCVESGNVGRQILQTDSVTELSSYSELIKTAVYITQTSSLKIGNGTFSVKSGCYGIKAKGSSYIIDESDLSVSYNNSSISTDIIIPVFNKFKKYQCPTIDKLLALGDAVNANIENVEITDDLTFAGSQRLLLKNREIHIEGNSASITCPNSKYVANFEMENSRIVIQNATFNVAAGARADQFYNCVINCAGKVELVFINCNFTVGAYAGIIDNISGLGNYGVVSGYRGVIIDAVFENCVFNGAGTIIRANCKASRVSTYLCTFNDTFTVGGTVDEVYQDYTL